MRSQNETRKDSTRFAVSAAPRNQRHYSRAGSPTTCTCRGTISGRVGRSTRTGGSKISSSSWTGRPSPKTRTKTRTRRNRRRPRRRPRRRRRRKPRRRRRTKSSTRRRHDRRGRARPVRGRRCRFRGRCRRPRLRRRRFLSRAAEAARSLTILAPPPLEKEKKSRKSSSWAPRELTREQEAGLRSFALFDDAGVGRLDESQLREVLRSADACVGGDEEAPRLARAVAENASGPDAGVLEDLKNAAKNSNLHALQDGRWPRRVVLAEAESPASGRPRRDATPGTRRRRKIVPFSGAELGFVCRARRGGALLEVTAGTAPPSSSRRRPPRSVSVSSTARWISRTTRRRCSSAAAVVAAGRRLFRTRPRRATTRARAVAKHGAGARSPPRTSSRFSRRAPRRRACELRCADTRCDFSTRFAPSTANSSDDSRTRRCMGSPAGMDIAPSAMMKLARKMDTTGDDGHVRGVRRRSTGRRLDRGRHDAASSTSASAQTSTTRGAMIPTSSASSPPPPPRLRAALLEPAGGVRPARRVGRGRRGRVGRGRGPDSIRRRGGRGCAHHRAFAHRCARERPRESCLVGRSPWYLRRGPACRCPGMCCPGSEFARQHSAFTKTWTSEATGTRRRVVLVAQDRSVGDGAEPRSNLPRVVRRARVQRSVRVAGQPATPSKSPIPNRGP